MFVMNIRSQADLEDYIRILPQQERCQFMLEKGISLCMASELKCPFQGKDYYTLRMGNRRECLREEQLKLVRILK